MSPFQPENSFYRPIADDAMKTVWDMSPNSFQKEIIPHILKIQFNPNFPMPLLLVQGTGGGKSAVAQTIRGIDAGVTLIIQNTLSLASDQRSKISSSRKTSGPVESFHLDALKGEKDIMMVRDLLSNQSYNTNSSIFLYVSPDILSQEALGIIN